MYPRWVFSTVLELVVVFSLSFKIPSSVSTRPFFLFLFSVPFLPPSLLPLNPRIRRGWNREAWARVGT